MLWRRCEFCPTGKSPPIAVQPLAQKFSAFLSTQIISVFAVSRAHKRGVGHRHERWAWDAVDAGCAVDDERARRTAKSRGPDAPTLASSSQEAPLLGSDGGKQARSPGRA